MQRRHTVVCCKLDEIEGHLDKEIEDIRTISGRFQVSVVFREIK